jgi:hypothetical protein
MRTEKRRAHFSEYPRGNVGSEITVREVPYNCGLCPVCQDLGDDLRVPAGSPPSKDGQFLLEVEE